MCAFIFKISTSNKNVCFDPSTKIQLALMDFLIPCVGNRARSLPEQKFHASEFDGCTCYGWSH